jgi:hypothetical protein
MILKGTLPSVVNTLDCPRTALLPLLYDSLSLKLHHLLVCDRKNGRRTNTPFPSVFTQSFLGHSIGLVSAVSGEWVGPILDRQSPHASDRRVAQPEVSFRTDFHEGDRRAKSPLITDRIHARSFQPSDDHFV